MRSGHGAVPIEYDPAKMARVLIFNFFGNVMHRGIPLYAEDIAEAMRRAGIEALELRGSRWLRFAPRPIRNAAFVLCEQLVAPLARFVLGCAYTVYPYNSAGIVDALLGRSVLVVHDLISNDKKNRSIASRYIRATQTLHRALGRPICAASVLTLAQLRRLDAFKRSPVTKWRNPFYSFMAALARSSGFPRQESSPLRVMLCSGMGPNKDYAGALNLFAASRALAQAELHIVGFGHDAPLARRRVERLPLSVAQRITVHLGLDVDALVAEYLAADIVWVHSKEEGFGRCIVEARLAARPAVVADISAFRKHKAAGVHFYDAETFDACMEGALQAGAVPAMDADAYHAPLEAAVVEMTNRFSARSPGESAAVPLPAEPSVDAAVLSARPER